MASEIVKPAFPSTEIIPSTKLEGLEEALSVLGAETSKLPALQVQAKNLLIESKEDYLIMAQIRSDARAIKKAGKNELGKYEDLTRRVLDWLKQKRLAHENAAELVAETICTPKMMEWDAKERAAAAAEEKRINEENKRKAAIEAEERRKAAQAQAEADRKQREKQIQEALKNKELSKREAEKERKWNEEQAKIAKDAAATLAELEKTEVQEVKVLSNTPAIAGSRRTTVYCFEVTDVSLVPRIFMQPDEQAIGYFWRTCKDVEKAKKQIPGVRFWTENRV